MDVRLFRALESISRFERLNPSFRTAAFDLSPSASRDLNLKHPEFVIVVASPTGAAAPPPPFALERKRFDKLSEAISFAVFMAASGGPRVRRQRLFETVEAPTF